MLKKSFSSTKPVCKVSFSLPVEAVTGKDVRILGDFNQWSWENGFRMKAGKTEFSTEVELEAGKEYQFRYLIDNHIWENDWKADDYVVSPFDGIYNSVISLKETKVAAAAAALKAAAKTAATTAKAASDITAPASKSTAVAAKPAAKAVAAKPAAKAAAPKKAAATTTADDLTKIEGIGPKIAELLANAGITTFADLAKAKAADVKKVLEAAGKRYQMHDPATWSEQAKLAAKGDFAKLDKLQVELKGGKRA